MWLQWGHQDLAAGLGGVEVHARSVARELKSLGWETDFSSAPIGSSEFAALAARTAVFHTHGTARPPVSFRKALGPGTIWIHTLHGTTLGRVSACGEWLWPGGYAAGAAELDSVARADRIAAVHQDLWLYKAALLAKRAAVVGNGWDASLESTASHGTDAATDALLDRIFAALPSGAPIWLYVGRANDVVKDAPLAVAAMDAVARIRPGATLVAVPGDGFPDRAGIVKTGRLSSDAIARLMRRGAENGGIHGLLLTSKYEGLPLVVLEALAQGLRVVTTDVGGIRTLPSALQGLTRIGSRDAEDLARQMLTTASSSGSAVGRQSANRAILPRWEDVARRYVALLGR